MAMTEVSIEDQSAAEKWMSEATDLNNRTRDALVGLQKDLEAVGDGASGELVQQFIDTATDVYNHTNEILKGMNGLLDVVTNVVNKFKEVLGAAAKEAGSKIRNLFSH